MTFLNATYSSASVHFRYYFKDISNFPVNFSKDIMFSCENTSMYKQTLIGSRLWQADSDVCTITEPSSVLPIPCNQSNKSVNSNEYL